ncbi:ArsR/SmtB family transcription factor [Natrinema marinum]|uniref:ArsR/SmtB family transcription factor n=1 Tax=Natrinema marinum TaxID=2961598 RepID=UPI0020C89223|nr:winged helix-turn-helix domain-containing protein [Natrinema marinum]
MADNDYKSKSDKALETPLSNAEPTVDLDELLAVLAEEYTNEIIAALGKESLSAREIADSSGASRPTVYRRLNRLESIGAVETTMAPSPCGQCRKEFRLILGEIEFSLMGDADIVQNGN